MNRKQFLILLALVAVVGVAGLLLLRHNHESWQGGGPDLGRKLLPDLSVNDTVQIAIQSGADTVTLARRDNLWRVRERADYPADFQKISQFLMTFDGLKVAQTEDLGPSQLGRLQLLPPGSGTNTGTSVEFRNQNGRLLGSVLVGKKHVNKAAANPIEGMGDGGWPDGRYVMVVGDPTVIVVSDTLDNVQARPDQWLNKDFLSMERPCQVAVQFPEATNSWELARASETNDWRLADARPGETLDPLKISALTSPFNPASFNDVAPLPTGGVPGNAQLTVKTFDGFTYVLKFGPKLGDNSPTSVSVTADLSGSKPDKALADKLAREQGYTHWMYLVPNYSVDAILKPRGELLVAEQAGSVPAPGK